MKMETMDDQKKERNVLFMGYFFMKMWFVPLFFERRSWRKAVIFSGFKSLYINFLKTYTKKITINTL